MKTNTISFLIILFMSGLFFGKSALGQGVGDPAPDFTLSTVEASSFTLSSQTDKVVFLFLFGYNCSHCLANGNNTETGIYQVYKDDPNFVALGIDTWDGNQSSVENFISSTGITYPVALNGSGVQSAYSTSYDRMIVIDQNGIIQYKATANATSSVVNEAMGVISELLATSSVENSIPDKDLFTVYPIPAKDELFVENNMANQSELSIKILSINGKQLKHIPSLKSTDNMYSVPVNDLNPGIYFIQFITAEQIQTKKIIIGE